MRIAFDEWLERKSKEAGYELQVIASETSQYHREKVSLRLNVVQFIFAWCMRLHRYGTEKTKKARRLAHISTGILNAIPQVLTFVI